MTLERGKWYFITWVDAVADTIGDIHEAEVAFRTLPLRFMAWKVKRWRGLRARYAVFATLEEEDKDKDLSQVGSWAIPAGMIRKAVELTVEDESCGHGSKTSSP